MKSSFVDLQVNGFQGVDFSTASLRSEDVIKVADCLEQRGTGAFLTTMVTSSMETYSKALPAIAKSIGSHESRGRILGVHLEGPFISPEDGAVGAHPKQHVLAPSAEALDKLMDLSEGNLKLITVAPERPGAIELILHARSKGVAVSLGHTLAGDSEIAAAIDAGATLSTHIGNGVPNMLHRHKNPIVAQLGSSLLAMLIADGHHLPPSFLRLALAAKGLDGALVVSDAAPVAGLPCGEYEIFGTRVRVCEDGAIRNLNAPTLAGSSASMLDCAKFLKKELSLGMKSIWRLCRENPLRAIGMDSLAKNLPELVDMESLEL